MAQRLVKIAKELNVGTTTIVEFLNNNGFEIDNKPTSKISQEMYDALLEKFSNSMAVKEKANKLVIGTRIEQKEDVITPIKEALAKPPVEEVKQESAPVEEAPKVEETPEASPAKEDVIIKAEAPKAELKVVGKIDLKKEEPKKEAPKEKPKAKKKEAPQKKSEKAPADPAPKEAAAKAEPTPEELNKSKVVLEAPVEDLVKVEAPQLKGLKIMGKIDTDKLKKPKPKKTEQAANKPSQGGNRAGNNSNQGKRKRTRTKISAQKFVKRNDNRNNKGGGRRKSDEVKTVSKKEIEEKIKSTMARLSGGGKKKRQKIRRDNRADKKEKQELKEMENVEVTLKVTEFISVSELSNLLNVPVTDVIMTCMNLGVIVSINQRLDAEIIELVATEFDQDVEFISAEEIEEKEEEIIDDPADLVPRAPIVTVMGHVDHGKTSLLDYIRSANVADGEAGGITQHIGAYEVAVGENKKKITFLDTPGHEAFTAMRARGAKVTDVVVVILAADDRMMPQSKEAISHAQAAGVPIVFAINKIDKDGADPERIKGELAEMNLLVEDWGGKFQSQDISAKTGENIDALLEKIILESELLELHANPKRDAVGTVIEASLDKGRGFVTKILVQNGTLKQGDIVVAGEHSGRIKAMFNEKGKRQKTAGPATPVLVLGLSGAPQAGEKFKVLESDQEARQIAAKRSQISREQTNRASKRISLDEIGRRLALGAFKELNLIVKGDVDGSIEALSDSLIKLSQETVQVNVIHKAVGQIAESDILLASASDAIVIGFQVRPSMNARQLAEREGVEIKTYSIIYEAIEEIKSAIEGMLEPTKEEKIVGQIEIREVYKISKVGTIAGCHVVEGKVKRNNHIRLIREGIVIYPNKEGVIGEIASLKRFKDDVKEVRNNMECGVSIKNYNDIKVGDVIEAYEIVEIKQKLAN
jgi:translation initiation factor IF-2